MQLFKLLITVLIVAGLISCSKKSGPAPAKTGNVEVFVKDGATGSFVSGAAVTIFESTAEITNNAPEYSQTTDQSGKAVFNVTNLDPTHITQLFVIAVKGGRKNYYDGLVPVGIFSSFSDIQNSAVPTPQGQVGGVKFLDANHDGQINSADQIPLPPYLASPTGVNVINVTIY